MTEFCRFGARVAGFAVAACGLMMLLASGADASNVGYEITINQPTAWQTVKGIVGVKVQIGPDVHWDQLMVDGAAVAAGGGNFNWNSRTVANGWHTLKVRVFQRGGTTPIGKASIAIRVRNATASTTGTVAMLPAIPAGQPLTYVTGNPGAIVAGIYGAKSYPLQAYGSYNNPNAVMGAGGTFYVGFGPLLDDRQAASVTMATVETTVASTADIAANRYYQDHVVDSVADQQNYLDQLKAVNQYWSGPMATVMRRVDGACPIKNPTTAEIIQWAANKWGFNPRYGYAEACDEGDWENTSLGDSGNSSGVFQVADRGAGHGWWALVQANSNLARESTCYNADFFFATRWASFHCAKAGCSTGISGESPPNSMGDTVQSWFSGSSYSCPGGADCDYQAMIYSDIVSGWSSAGYGNDGSNPPCWYVGGHYFNSAIPIHAAKGTVPHE